MTLKELLDRCDFKDVAQALVKLYPSIDGTLVPGQTHFNFLGFLLNNRYPNPPSIFFL